MTDWNLTFTGKSTADEVLEGIDLTGRTAVVTGANVGIGLETARALAARGANVTLACRDEAKGQVALRQITHHHPEARVSVAKLDLASLESVRDFAGAFAAPGLDILVCNAGRYGGGYQETSEGHELTVGVCHIGHFLLVQLLLEKILAARGRVVMVSSESHRSPGTLDFDKLPLKRSEYKDLTSYGQAKLCNILMAKELQRRFGDQGLTAYSLHPGTLIPTSIGRNSALAKVLILLVRPFTKSLAQGAATTVLCAAHPSAASHAGAYFSDCRPKRSSRESNDTSVAERLWHNSCEWTSSVS